MKAYLAQLAKQYDGVLEVLVSPEGEAGLKKLSGGKLLPGSRCAWCYQDDVDYWRSEKEPMPYPGRWPYQGFIIPFPETDGRGEMDAEHVCVVVTDYPVEKENPVTDWGALAHLLATPSLHRFYVFSRIRAMEQKGPQ